MTDNLFTIRRQNEHWCDRSNKTDKQNTRQKGKPVLEPKQENNPYANQLGSHSCFSTHTHTHRHTHTRAPSNVWQQLTFSSLDSRQIRAIVRYFLSFLFSFRFLLLTLLNRFERWQQDVCTRLRLTADWKDPSKTSSSILRRFAPPTDSWKTAPFYPKR